MTCIHKTYDTEERATSKWFSLGKKRRDGLTVYQCPKCLGWRVISYGVMEKLRQEEIDGWKEKAQEKATARRRKKVAEARSICSECETTLERYQPDDQPRYDYLYCPNCETIACRVQRRKVVEPTPLPAIPKAQPAPPAPTIATVVSTGRKFAKRPKRAAKVLARETMAQAFTHIPFPEFITAEQREGWFMIRAVAKAGDKPTTGLRILAAKKLGPFGDLPKWLQLDLLAIGVPLPRTEYGRIPLGEALSWEMKRTKRQIKQGLPARTFHAALTGHALRRYGARGKDYAQSVAAWVMDYDANRDLRRNGFHLGLGGVKDRRRPHRVRRANPDKPNRWRKFTTRSLKHYWAWLVSILNKTAKHQGNLPENLVVLPYDDGRLPPDGTRHTRRKPTE